MSTLRDRIDDIVVELDATHKERLTLIKGVFIALGARSHAILVGPPGTGKSMLLRDVASRITDITTTLPDGRRAQPLFETSLDRLSDPSALFGPVDIRAMRDEGQYRHVTTGMLPEAILGFLDEINDANGPVRRRLLPVMNERIFHNGGTKVRVPLWSLFSGTNRLDPEPEQAAVWDRWHLRFVVDYLSSRDNVRAMVEEDMARRIPGYTEPPKTTITEAELLQFHAEALAIHMPDETWNILLDMRDELLYEGVQISDRRINDGTAACKVNAWLNGHDTVMIGDLEALQHVWWTSSEDHDKAVAVILGHANPSEKEAIELAKTLESREEQLKAAESEKLDQVKLRMLGMEVYKDTKRTLSRLAELRKTALAAGASTHRLETVSARCEALMTRIQADLFSLGA